jgi:hypothetical protein
MLVSEAAFAAAVQPEDEAASVYDEIGCLLAAHPGGIAGATMVWVHDTPTGDWIDARNAAFVRAAAYRTPMGGGILAFRDLDDAARAAGEHQGTIFSSLADLLARTSEDTQ